MTTPTDRAMTPERIGELKRLCEQATPGPWALGDDYNDQRTLYVGEEWIAILPHQCVASIEEQRDKDAAFIAAARTALPDCIEALKAERVRAEAAEATVARLEARWEQLKVELEDYANQRGDEATSTYRLGAKSMAQTAVDIMARLEGERPHE